MLKNARFYVFILLILLVSCEAEFRFSVPELDDFIVTLEDEYDFITDSKITQSQGHINIKIYFDSSKEQKFDEQIYTNIYDFFIDESTQNKIIKEYDEANLQGSNYPIIAVKFLDKSEVESHFISSPIDFVNYGTSWNTKNRYAEWSEPHYWHKKK